MKISKKKPNYEVTLQKITKHSKVPSRYYFKRWVDKVLTHQNRYGDINIRLIDSKESAKLNQTYRHKIGPTNILSFSFDAPKNIELPVLGDLVICAPLVAKEAREQNKPWIAHWAHLVVHGVLHLLGFDHVKKKDAKVMETIEIKILAQLGFENPYSDMGII